MFNTVVLANPDFNSFNNEDSYTKENSNLYSKDFKDQEEIVNQIGALYQIQKKKVFK